MFLSRRRRYARPLRRFLRLLRRFAARFPDCTFRFHPGVENGFLELPSIAELEAGILSSETYRYKVSGLTPRYCEACLMFITSGESAIAADLSTEFRRFSADDRFRPAHIQGRSSFAVLGIVLSAG